MHEADPFSSPRARGDGRVRVREAWGAVQDAARQMGDAAQRAVGYLRAHQSDEITADAIRVARKRPAQTLIGAAALGFLVGALFSALGRR